MFSPLLALATYLNHVHHVQCACGCSVLAWHWQRTWTGLDASKHNTADPRKAHKLAVTVLISSQCVPVEKNRILVACIESCCAEQALCEARPRGTALFRQLHVLLTDSSLPWPCKTGASTCDSNCTSNSLRSPPAGQAPALLCTTCKRFVHHVRCAQYQQIRLCWMHKKEWCLHRTEHPLHVGVTRHYELMRMCTGQIFFFSVFYGERTMLDPVQRWNVGEETAAGSTWK